MPEDAALPVAVYRVEPEHFGSRALRSFRLAFDFGIVFTVLFFAEFAHNYLDKVMGLAKYSAFHTTQQIALAAAVWALPCIGWLHWNRRAQRFRLAVQANQITQIKKGETVTFFPGNFAKVSEEHGLLSVPGLLVRG